MNSPYFYETLSAADRDQALIDALGRVVRECHQFKDVAAKLMGDAAKGNFKAGWQEEAEGVIARAFGSPMLRRHLEQAEAR